MEITKDIYEWLLLYQIVSPQDIADDTQEDKVVLNQNTSQKFENGIKVAKLIQILYQRTVTHLYSKNIPRLYQN